MMLRFWGAQASVCVSCSRIALAEFRNNLRHVCLRYSGRLDIHQTPTRATMPAAEIVQMSLWSDLVAASAHARARLNRVSERGWTPSDVDVSQWYCAISFTRQLALRVTPIDGAHSCHRPIDNPCGTAHRRSRNSHFGVGVVIGEPQHTCSMYKDSDLYTHGSRPRSWPRAGTQENGPASSHRQI